MFGRGAWGSGTLKTPQNVFLTTQLLSRNQKFINTSADIPAPLKESAIIKQIRQVSEENISQLKS